jgi:hypothetical protein
MTRDARLPALHRGGFRLPGPRFSHRYPASACASAGRGSDPASSSQPGRSAWRAASLPPEATVTSRRRRTPRLAPPTGSPPETPLNERDCESSSIDAMCSQALNTYCSYTGEIGRSRRLEGSCPPAGLRLSSHSGTIGGGANRGVSVSLAERVKARTDCVAPSRCRPSWEEVPC